MEKVLITAFIIGIVSGIGYGSFQAGKRSTEPSRVYASTKEIDTSDVNYKMKIDELKNKVIDKLASCESGGLKDEDGIIVFDTNNKASIGVLQFQKNTVIHYYKVLYGKTITAKEAVLIALDPIKAKNLAKDVIFTTKNKAGGDWVNCNKKFNLDAQVDLIKSLE